MTVVVPPSIVSITANLAELVIAESWCASPLEAFADLWVDRFLDPDDDAAWKKWMTLQKRFPAEWYARLGEVLTGRPRMPFKLRALFHLLTFNPELIPQSLGKSPKGTAYFWNFPDSEAIAPKLLPEMHLPACGLVIAFARLLAEQHKATRPGDYPWRISEAYNRELLWWLKYGLGSAPVRDPDTEQVLEAYQIHVPGSHQSFLRDVFDDPDLPEALKVALDLRARMWVREADDGIKDRLSSYIAAVANGWKTKRHLPYSRELLHGQARFVLQMLQRRSRPPRVSQVHDLVRVLRGPDMAQTRHDLISTLRPSKGSKMVLEIYLPEWQEIRALIRIIHSQDAGLADYLQAELDASKKLHGPDLEDAKRARRREANELAAAWKALC